MSALVNSTNSVTKLGCFNIKIHWRNITTCITYLKVLTIIASNADCLVVESLDLAIAPQIAKGRHRLVSMAVATERYSSAVAGGPNVWIGESTLRLPIPKNRGAAKNFPKTKKAKALSKTRPPRV